MPLFVCFFGSTSKHEHGRQTTGLLTPSRRLVDVHKHKVDVYNIET